jgi:hypothetical protein
MKYFVTVYDAIEIVNNLMLKQQTHWNGGASLQNLTFNQLNKNFNTVWMGGRYIIKIL